MAICGRFSELDTGYSMMITRLNHDTLKPSHLREKRFLDDAILILGQISARAAFRGMTGELHAALVLWSLLRWEKRPGTEILLRCGARLQVLETTTDALLREHTSDPPCDVMDFARISEVVRESERQAQQLGHNYVGTEHLVLALCACDPDVARLFEEQGVTDDGLRAALNDIQSELEQWVRDGCSGRE